MNHGLVETKEMPLPMPPFPRDKNEGGTVLSLGVVRHKEPGVYFLSLPLGGRTSTTLGFYLSLESCGVTSCLNIRHLEEIM